MIIQCACILNAALILPVVGMKLSVAVLVIYLLFEIKEDAARKFYIARKNFVSRYLLRIVEQTVNMHGFAHGSCHMELAQEVKLTAINHILLN